MKHIFNESYIASCLEALDKYDIGEPVMAFRSRSVFAAGDEVEVPSKGSIVGEGIISFSGNLSGVNRSDAQNAFHYATLVANKQFPNEHQGREWYELFREVMTNTGWTPISRYYNDLEVSGTSVRMDKLVLEILASVVTGLAVPGPATALMLKTAGDAIAALQKRDTALTLYERNLLKQGVGGVTVGSCTEINGVAVFGIGAVRFTRRNSSTKVMFVDTDVRNVNMYRGETAFERNDLLAEATRKKIADALIKYSADKLDYDI
ncbi:MULTISPECIES: hypothetical protein [unclassified Pseudomonas]|uniref:hypothetical protein n=1 Tax=unclassified Pseudomonas TaxID=196821 RepID=UPI000A1ED301|nr:MULTISPECIES: hypothetical protein [unclassified Pseudomonas]